MKLAEVSHWLHREQKSNLRSSFFISVIQKTAFTRKSYIKKQNKTKQTTTKKHQTNKQKNTPNQKSKDSCCITPNPGKAFDHTICFLANVRQGTASANRNYKNVRPTTGAEVLNLGVGSILNFRCAIFTSGTCLQRPIFFLVFCLQIIFVLFGGYRVAIWY